VKEETMMKKMRTIMVWIAVGVIVWGTAAIVHGQNTSWKDVGSGEKWEPFGRTTWIGVLKGSFYQMGVQYGERAAYDIRTNTDYEWPSCVKVCGSAKELSARLERYRFQLQLYSPQTLDFLRGIADGAASILSKSSYAKESTNFERVFNLNVSSTMKESCNSFWVTGGATADGTTMVTHHSQSLMGVTKSGRKVTFVAIPDDPEAHIVWSITDAGCIGRGGTLANDAGVFNALHASDSNKTPESKAEGVEHHVSRFHAVVYGGSAKEAAEFINLGTPEYRKLTGRKTLLRTRGVALIFADANSCFIGEYTANRYALRKPGDLGEAGSNFICQSNHNHLNFSYDENNQMSQVPMTKFSPEVTGDGSYHRFWSPMWAIKQKYGKIDREMVLRDLTALHDIYDKDGTKRDYIRGHTFCVHEFNETRGPGGSHAPVVFIPKTLEINYLHCWPCRYTDKDWNSLNLNDYIPMRRLVRK
jgi:hypothetical protein